MSTICLEDYYRDLATPSPERNEAARLTYFAYYPHPELKWVLSDDGQWTKVQMIRIRKGNGWIEIPAQETPK